MDRRKDALLVWESVLDAAKETEDQGTFCRGRSFLALDNDRIESHAMALRATQELKPTEEKLDGMVLWLFLNKKLNHWKSTRATAEVIYALAHYLKATKQLGLTEETTVKVGDLEKTFVFEPDRFTGKKNQIVIPEKRSKRASGCLRQKECRLSTGVRHLAFLDRADARRSSWGLPRCHSNLVSP